MHLHSPRQASRLSHRPVHTPLLAWLLLLLTSVLCGPICCLLLLLLVVAAHPSPPVPPQHLGRGRNQVGERRQRATDTYTHMITARTACQLDRRPTGPEGMYLRLTSWRPSSRCGSSWPAACPAPRPTGRTSSRATRSPASQHTGRRREASQRVLRWPWASAASEAACLLVGVEGCSPTWTAVRCS